MSPLKKTLLDINNAYIFFCASIYLGMFWSLHYFWFPNYPKTLNLSNYYDAIIPQTDLATKFFFVSIPIMAVALVIMLITEWKTGLRWVPLAWIPGLLAPVLVQQLYIEDVNNQFKAGLTDEATLQALLDEWMFLNDVRWIILTIMWLITMYFFIAKAKPKHQYNG
ncbi:MAG: hypothetical protein GYB55_24720 [Cytophagales bacterium]|uniref:hypothetical protein n=1 Tax=Cyclobacterium marinum TaxID=104 RepID=UPI0011F013DD|nr:hypothetical protein [Cyclobacterium marinum]MBI0397854.1 hypothetical protein [Cyclobacterium marinum]MBR9778056.1 hypothetical protein [Cytophagales bacterium]|tara:strand:- start:54002 stop:54499 length:498 start_codon:yes stop_codon:yes gene_type:complete